MSEGVFLNSDLAIQLFSQLMWNAALIAAPLLVTTLAVGLLVSVFQAVTQIQEMSLTFIPKLLASAAVLVAVGPWMLKRLVDYSAALINGIPQYF
jgi:flagellar biosynthetic protein FliQ